MSKNYMLKKTGAIATIIFNRPEKKNSFSLVDV